MNCALKLVAISLVVGWSATVQADVNNQAAGAEAAALSLISTDVSNSLPEWDESVFLAGFLESDWSQDVAVDAISLAVGDSVPPLLRVDETKTVYRNDSAAMLIDINSARVAYVSQDRRYEFGQAHDVGIDQGEAERIGFEVIAALGIPEHEIHDVVVKRILLGISGGDGEEAESVLEKETLVSFQRSIDGILVQESFVNVVIANDGNVARLNARWPDFFVDDSLMFCRAERDVVDEIATNVHEYVRDSAYSIRQRMVYAQVSHGENDGYVPSVDVVVVPENGGGGVGFVVPVVE